MLRKHRKQLAQKPLLTIAGHYRTPRADAPVTKASLQLVIQMTFMMLYAYALTHILLRAIHLPVHTTTLALVMIATFALCYIFLKFRKYFLISLGIMTIIVVFALIWPDGWAVKVIGRPLYNLFAEFNSWFMKAFLQVDVAEIDYSRISAVFAFLISLFMFTWINLSSAPYAMGLLASIAYGLAEFLDKGVHGIEIKLLYLLAMFVVLRFLAERKPARSHYLTLRQMTDGKCRLSSGDASRRNGATAIALFLIIIIVLLDVALPADFFHNKWLDDSISRVVGRRHEDSDKPIGYLEFTLKTLGYYPLETRIGGTALPDDTPYISIDTDGRPLWLKGSSSRHYTGYSWLPESMNPNWLFGHSAAWESQSRYIGVPQTNREEFMELALRETTINIRPEQEQQVVFQSGRPMSFSRITTNRAFSAYFNSVGQMYLDQIIPEGGYSSTGQSFNVLHLQSAEQLNRFNDLYTAKEGTFKALTDKERESYLQLPDMRMLRDDVRAFDEDLYHYIYNRENSFSDADVIAKICESLSSRMTYSLEVGYPAENEEFVSWFLREKKGYCTFFATAVTVLAREAGIPARYVEGFLVPATKPGTTPTQTLTGMDAHAWGEVWLNQAGWVPVDATPRGALEELSRSDYAQQHESKETEPTETPTEEPVITEPPETTKETVPEPEPVPPIEAPTKTTKGWSLLLWLLYLTPLWLFLLWRYYIYRIRHRETYITRALHRLGTRELVKRIAWDIFSLWELAGEKRTESESVRSFILRVEALRNAAIPSEFIHFLERALYAPSESHIVRDDESLGKLLAYYREEEVHAKKTLKWRKWFLRRWLTSRRHPF